MFGLSFSEIFIIAIVALIVIGPERLPKTARTLGLLVGRAQRYVNDIKSDIEREMHVDDIKKFKDEVTSNVSQVKSSVEGEITSITNPIKNISNPLEAVKSEVQDLEKQLKGSLNPLPDLDELKLDDLGKKAASVPLTEAPKVAASKSATAVAAGVSPVTSTSTASSKPVTKTEPEASATSTAALEPTTVSESKSVVSASQKLVDSTVAEAIIYPEEDDAQLASGADVVKQRWSSPALEEADSIEAVTVTEEGVNTEQQVAGIYDGPVFEPLVEPDFDPEEYEARSEAWDSLAELIEGPVDSEKSLEGLNLWEQLPEDKTVERAQEQTVAVTEDKNNSNSGDGGANV